MAVEARSGGEKVASEAGRCGSVRNVRGGSAALETAPPRVAGLGDGRGRCEERLSGRTAAVREVWGVFEAKSGEICPASA